MADISQHLNTIQTATNGESVRDAIIRCMKDINADSAIRATNLTIKSSENVTHTAPKGYAFKNVTVNIDEGEDDPSKTYTYEELSITNETENGTYPPEDKPNTVYSKVIVEIDWDAIAGAENIGPYGVITRTQPDPETGQQYWDANDAGYDAVRRVYLGEGISVGGGITPGGGTYIDPGSNPGGANGPFTVTFKDDNGTTIAVQQQIPKGMSVYEGSDPNLSDKLNPYEKASSKGSFAGWSGNISSVTSSFTSQPTYAKATGTIGNWAETMKDGGASVAIGESAALHSKAVTIGPLSVTGRAAYDNVGGELKKPHMEIPKRTFPASFITLKPMCVAHGENGTNTTWLSTIPIGVTLNDIITNTNYGEAGTLTGPTGANGSAYGTSDIVNSFAYQLVQMLLPLFFPDAIRSKLKYDGSKDCYGLDNLEYSVTSIRQHPDDFIENQHYPAQVWLPSLTELSSLKGLRNSCANKYNDWDNANQQLISEPNYIHDSHAFELNEGKSGDYGSVWYPTDNSAQINTPTNIITRSSTTNNGNNLLIMVYGKRITYPNNYKEAPYISVNNGADISSWYIGFNT